MDLILMIRWYKAKSARHLLPPTRKAGRRTWLVSFNHFLQLTTVILVTWWPTDCPQSPCIAAASLPLFITKLLRLHTSLPAVMPQHNDVWSSSHSQTRFWQERLNKLVKGYPKVCVLLLFKLHWNFYFLLRVSHKKGLNVCKFLCIMKIAVL